MTQMSSFQLSELWLFILLVISTVLRVSLPSSPAVPESLFPMSDSQEISFISSRGGIESIEILLKENNYFVFSNASKTVLGISLGPQRITASYPPFHAIIFFNSDGIITDVEVLNGLVLGFFSDSLARWPISVTNLDSIITLNPILLDANSRQGLNRYLNRVADGLTSLGLINYPNED